jgi:hypothetical protein
MNSMFYSLRGHMKTSYTVFSIVSVILIYSVRYIIVNYWYMTGAKKNYLNIKR